MISPSKFARQWFMWGSLMLASMAHSIKIELPPDAIILESNSGKMDKGVKIVNEKGTSEGVENEGKAVSHLSLAIPLLLHKSASI